MLHAARKFSGLAFFKPGQSGHAEKFRDAALEAGSAIGLPLKSPQARKDLQVFAARERFIEPKRLRHEGNAGGEVFVVGVRRRAEDRETAFVRCFQTAEEPHESVFARSVRSHQCNEPIGGLGAPRFEADAVHRTDRTGSVEGVGKSLDNALKMDRWG